MIVARLTPAIHAFPILCIFLTRRHRKSPLPHAEPNGPTRCQAKTTNSFATAASHPSSIPPKKRRPKKPRRRKHQHATFADPLTARAAIEISSADCGCASVVRRVRALSPFNAPSVASRALLVPDTPLEMAYGCAVRAKTQQPRRSYRRHRSLLGKVHRGQGHPDRLSREASVAKAYPAQSAIVTISTLTTAGSHERPCPLHRSQSDLGSHSKTQKRRRRVEKRNSAPPLR